MENESEEFSRRMHRKHIPVRNRFVRGENLAGHNA